jgi:hypothetical protein
MKIFALASFLLALPTVAESCKASFIVIEGR